MHVYVGALPPLAYIHFLGSLALCGLMAAAYPFLAITFLAVRCFYGAFARPGEASPGDLTEMTRLGRRLWGYLLLAASVPLLGVTVLALIGSGNRLALAVLSVGGLAGLALGFRTFRLIRADLAALRWALYPPRTLLHLSGETFTLRGSAMRP
jgi:hypothetical protein